MSLADLIQGKNLSGKSATAISAISATQTKEKSQIVAGVATVAVTNAPKYTPTTIRQSFTPLTTEEELASRLKLNRIKEADPSIIAETVNHWQQDVDEQDGSREQVITEWAKYDPSPDDRRTCNQCTNLIGRVCQAAKRGEIVARRNHEPIRDLPRRCEGYAPGPDDPDKRHGRERWFGLTQKGEQE